MNYQEFMRLPLESRKKIELAILDLDKAVQAHHGISMLKRKATDSPKPSESSGEHKTLRELAQDAPKSNVGDKL